MWALIENGEVKEVTDIDPEGRFHPDLVWVECGDDVGERWLYSDGVFSPPQPPEPSDEEVEAWNKATLVNKIALAGDQNTALTRRVGVLRDAIDLEMATQEEVDELPVRESQLLAWKRYAIYLGRVTNQEGWALSVEWPEQPEQGMDLSVSARAQG